MTSEEKRQEKLLLLLLALATDTERRVFIPQRRRIMMIMRKLRRIVQRMSPTGSFRTYEWARLKPLVLPLLNELSWSLRNQLLRELQPLIPEVQDAAADFMNPLETDMPVLVPRTQAELAETTTDGTSNVLLVMFGAQLAASRYSLKLSEDLDKKVQGMIMQGATTQEIADQVVKVIQYKGKPTTVLNSGSYASQVMNRVKNTIAGAAWSAVSNELLTAMQDVEVSTWVWNAVLDPETCPICRPLDKQTRAKPGLFPYSPPVHPNCRCAVLPVLT
tara:strand:- start:396 stop:1220 length:825 start_codon:yes stop_codon:yes gene_type:complete